MPPRPGMQGPPPGMQGHPHHGMPRQGPPGMVRTSNTDPIFGIISYKLKFFKLR
jgi:hypothetical protein